MFGISAFQEEEKKRRRSAGSMSGGQAPGFGAQQMDGASGSGVLAEAAVGVGDGDRGEGEGYRANKQQRLQGQAAVAPAADEEVLGTDSIATAGGARGDDEQKGAAAAAGAGGQGAASRAAAGGEGGGAVGARDFIAELGVIDFSLLKQPSLLAPAGGMVAPEDVPFFDPLTQHRSWCPWVMVGAGKALKEALAGAAAAAIDPAAAGGSSSGAAAGLDSAEGGASGVKELPGWMVLVMALQGEEMVKRAAARAAGQGGDMPSSADVQRRTKELLGMLRDA